MPWFKVDDGFANSKPVLRIPRRYRTAAVGLWTLAGTWSAKELTDGFIPDYVLDDLASTPAMAGQLVTAGLWEAVVRDGLEGWQFVGWSTYQPTKVEVLERRAAEAEKKRVARDAARRGRDQRKQNVSPRDSLGDTSWSPDIVPQGVRSTRPDPTRPVPITPVETSSGGVTSVDTRDPDTPRPHCSKHETNSSLTNCLACKARREWDDAQAAAEAKAKSDLRKIIDACDQCDDFARRPDLSMCPLHDNFKDRRAS